MDAHNALEIISDELYKNFSSIDDDNLDLLINAIENAGSICFCGQGREGLILSAFAMRVYHMGFNVFVAGEASARALFPGDLLVLSCGSGSSKIADAQIETAKESGAKVALITAHPNSDLSKKCDVVICLSGKTVSDPESSNISLQPLGSSFEQCEFVALDYIVYKMMVKNNWSESDLSCRHTNIQ